jgi:hypothetical protein
MLNRSQAEQQYMPTRAKYSNQFGTRGGGLCLTMQAKFGISDAGFARKVLALNFVKICRENLTLLRSMAHMKSPINRHGRGWTLISNSVYMGRCVTTVLVGVFNKQRLASETNNKKLKNNRRGS